MTVLSQIGYTGLNAAQVALNTTAQNIANVNTPGFSRLRPELHSLAGHTLGSVGGGVKVSEIRRIANDFQTRQVWHAHTSVNYHSSTQQYMTALEGLIGNDGSSISTGLDNFFAALSEATTTPESIVLRQQIMAEAEQLSQRFNSLNSNIQTQIDALHGQRAAMTVEINGLLGNVAELNQRIVALESTGRDTATLRDHRDSLIHELSAFADIHVQHMHDGSYGVSLANGQPLVLGATAGELGITRTDSGEQFINLRFAASAFPLNPEGLGGAFGGLYDSEYSVLRPAQDDLHAMASALAQMVNDALGGGFDLDGDQGKPLFVYNGDSITSMLVITPLKPEELAFSSADNEKGNNDVLLELLELRGSTIIVAGSEVSLNDAYAGLLGRVASASRQNKADLSSAQTVLQEAQAQRDSTSAVSLDEEAVNLMSYMQAYQANMKVISTSNELFDMLLAMF